MQKQNLGKFKAVASLAIFGVMAMVGMFGSSLTAKAADPLYLQFRLLRLSPVEKQFSTCLDLKFTPTDVDSGGGDATVHGAADFNYTIRPESTATSPDDFILNGSVVTTGTVHIPAGTGNFCLPVVSYDDALVESEENLVVELNSVSGPGFVLGSRTIFNYRIIDNDSPINVNVESATGAEVEGSSSSIKFVVDLPTSVPPQSFLSKDILVHYTIAGTASLGDFSVNNASAWLGDITIPFGSRSVSVPLATLEDGEVEGDETVVVTITSVESVDPRVQKGNNLVYTSTIIDNDSPTVLNLTASITENAENLPGSFTATLNRTSTELVTFQWKTAPNTAVNIESVIGGNTFPADFVGSNDWVTSTIPAGDLSVTVNALGVNNDNLSEPDENFNIIINPNTVVGALAGSILNQVYTISANDAPDVTFFSNSASGLESVTSPAFSLVMSSASPLDTTVDLSTLIGNSSAIWGDLGVAGNDIRLSINRVTIPAGQTQVDVNLLVADDSLVENDETATLFISNAVGANTSLLDLYTYTILNNDAVPVVPPPQGGNGGGGGGGGGGSPVFNAPVGGFSVAVQSEVAGTNPAQVNLVLNGGTATRMAIANTPDFVGASQVVYRTSTVHTLTAGNGLKTIYARFFDFSGTASVVVTATTTITITSTPVSVAPTPITPEVLGVKITRLDELVAKLKAGQTNSEVMEMQNELKKLGYFNKSFKATKFYGSMTKAAVKKYLADKNKKPVVAKTLDELVATLKLGQKSDLVKQMQTELKKLKFFPANLVATGYYGPATKTAVNKYLASK